MYGKSRLQRYQCKLIGCYFGEFGRRGRPLIWKNQHYHGIHRRRASYRSLYRYRKSDADLLRSRDG